MKLSREWATPLTIGAFALMAATGTAMFFHLNNGLQKEIHEWAGWAMVAAVGCHVVVNAASFKKHLRWPGQGALLVLGLLAFTLLTFVPWGADGGQETSPPAVAMRALTQAPLREVAPLFHKSPEEALKALSAAGIAAHDADETLAMLTHGDREDVGKALRALAQENHPPTPAP
jgi:hypothetical protein